MEISETDLDVAIKTQRHTCVNIAKDCNLQYTMQLFDWSLVVDAETVRPGR